MIGKNILHYKILAKLGEGGMGVVYKAEDTRLERLVAIKFLPHHIADNADERQRFKIEAKAAAALNHPNIATIYAIEEFDGDMFIVMEFIEGKELREIIQSEIPNLQSAIEYATQIAEGLKAAHAKGITHRDIKSSNIMVTESGQVKITDFGLAKIGDGVHLTKSGITLGTAAYMSPEQARGEPVDHRTDIWSFGVVLYEMLTAHLPFRGEYEAAMMYSILNERPEPLIAFRSDLPSHLQPIIDCALEKDPARRYQNIQDFIKDLKERSSFLTTATEQQKSIVVLPFEDISPGKDNEYFSDGLTEEIIADLSKIHTLRVISRTSAMMLKSTRKDLKTIGKELNVQYALEGSVRKAGNNLRVTAQLIDAVNDAHLWAEKYNGTLEDVFDMQEKVSRAIVDALKLKLSPEEDRRMAERPIANVHAYECYLRARHAVWQWTNDSLERALQYLQNALDIIGENALLYAGMGYVYFQFVNMGIKQEDYISKAEECAKKVFALEPESPYGHFLLGLFQQVFHGNQKQSVNHFKQALAINPNDPDVLQWLALGYFYVGKTNAGILLAERLSKIDPLNQKIHLIPGMLHWMEGRFDLACEVFQKVHQMDPKNPITRFIYARLLTYNQRLEEAYSLIDQLAKDTPQTLFAQLGLFMKYAFQGEKSKALQLMTPELQITARRDLELSWHLASWYAVLGVKQEALDWLENAVNRGFINYPFFSKLDPFLENIRGEERFAQLMEKVKDEWERFEV